MKSVNFQLLSMVEASPPACLHAHMSGFELLNDINQSTYVGLDCEFTGLTDNSSNGRPFVYQYRDLQRYYEEKTAGAGKVICIQLGLCCAIRNGDTFELKPYNISVFPQRGGFYMQSSAVMFLRSHGFDFNALIDEGLSYLTEAEEQEYRQALKSPRPARVWADQVQLIAECKKTTEDWLSQQVEDVENVLMHSCKGQHEQTVVYQELTKHFREQVDAGSIYICKRVDERVIQQQQQQQQQQSDEDVQAMEVTTSSSSSSNASAVATTTPTSKKRKNSVSNNNNTNSSSSSGRMASATPVALDRSGAAEMEEGEVKPPTTYVLCVMVVHGSQRIKSETETDIQQVEEKIRLRVGVRSIFDCLKSHPSLILTGHNCFLDLIITYSQFVEPLPATVHEAKLALRNIFPRVIDTKYIASRIPLFANDLGWKNGLGGVYEYCKRQFQLPALRLDPTFSRYTGDAEHYHEAGFDAYCTVYACLKLVYAYAMSQQVDANSPSLLAPYLNRMNLFGFERGFALDQVQPNMDLHAMLALTGVPLAVTDRALELHVEQVIKAYREHHSLEPLTKSIDGADPTYDILFIGRCYLLSPATTTTSTTSSSSESTVAAPRLGLVLCLPHLVSVIASSWPQEKYGPIKPATQLSADELLQYGLQQP